MLFRNDLPYAPLLSTNLLWIDNFETQFVHLMIERVNLVPGIMCAAQTETWIVPLKFILCLSAIKTLSGLCYDFTDVEHIHSSVYLTEWLSRA